jgi:hypothetical protein
VLLNGVEAFGPSAFSPNVEQLWLDVALSEPSTLEVTLGGKPGSELTI